VVFNGPALRNVEEVVDELHALPYRLLVDKRGVDDVATLLLHVLDRVAEFVEVVVPIRSMCVENGVFLATHFVELQFEVTAYFDEVFLYFLALRASEARLLFNHEL